MTTNDRRGGELRDNDRFYIGVGGYPLHIHLIQGLVAPIGVVMTPCRATF